MRGGRYDEVGAVFGRNRPAVGFSLDVQGTGRRGAPSVRCKAAIRAPWLDGRRTRPNCVPPSPHCAAQGETVVCVLPGHDSEIDEFQCDRELASSAAANGVVKPSESSDIRETI